MAFYNKDFIEKIDKGDSYYIPDLLFDSDEYRMVRIEVKWAFVACLNVLIDNPLYDETDHAYLKDCENQLIDTLKKLANKNVDEDKISGYLDELEDYGLIKINEGRIYLKKVEHIF